MHILLQNVTLPLGSGAGSLPLSYPSISSNKHLWPLSNRLFCQNCFTLLSYRFIFTAFTIILCSSKTTWRPFSLVLYLPSGTSKTLLLIGCALCSSFLHAQWSPNDKRSCPSHLPYSKIISQKFSKPRSMLDKTKKTYFPWGHPNVSNPIEHGQQRITARVYSPLCLTRNIETSTNKLPHLRRANIFRGRKPMKRNATRENRR